MTTSTGDMWTVDEAAGILDPPLTTFEIRSMINLMGILPAGTRTGRGAGRPPAQYPATVLMRAHAAIIDARAANAGNPDCRR